MKVGAGETAPVERVRHKKMHGQRPSYRVYRAMERLSMNRWISGPQVMEISFALARCASPSRPSQVAHSAVSGAATVIGMLFGKAPCSLFETDYGQFVKELGGKEFPAGVGELKIWTRRPGNKLGGVHVRLTKKRTHKAERQMRKREE